MPSEPVPEWVIAHRRHIGTRLRDLRMTRAWTQERLAERTGLARETISSVENGTHSPLLDHLILITDALGVPLRSAID